MTAPTSDRGLAADLFDTAKAWASYVGGYELGGKAAHRVQRLQDERKLRAYRKKPGDPMGPPLVGTARMKELMSRHYLEGRFANGVVFVFRPGSDRTTFIGERGSISSARGYL